MRRLIQIFLSVLLLWTSSSSSSSSSSFNPSSRMSVRADGGYEGLVVRVEKDVPEEDCRKVVGNIKVRKEDTRI